MSVSIPGLTDLVEIGRGGFAIVYRARQEAVGRHVAVKVLAALDLDNDEQRRFRQECRAMGALSSHPNIVQVFDAGTSGEGMPYIVMEFMPGGSLWQRVRATGRLPATELLEAGVQLCGALESAHRAGILHRDIKPENVLLDAAGANRLTDFGIAAVDDGTRSLSGAVSGTMAFLPPEVVRGERATVRSDVYQLGATLHALATGSAPFRRPTDANAVSALARILNEEPADLQLFGVPQPLSRLILNAMAKEPAARHGSAAAFGGVLLEVQRTLGIPTSRFVVVDAGQTVQRADDTIRVPPSAASEYTVPRPLDPIDSQPPTVRRNDTEPAPVASPAAHRRRRSVLAMAVAAVVIVVALGAAAIGALVVRSADGRAAATSTTDGRVVRSDPSPVQSSAGSTATTTPASAATTVARPPAALALPSTSLPDPTTTLLGTVAEPTSQSSPAPEPLAVELARSYASALAAHDWATARTLNPSLPDDATLDKGYRYLDEQFVVDARTSPTGDNVNDVRLLVLAHESPPAGHQTSFWCFHWQVDAITHTVRSVDGRRLQTYPGTLDTTATPADLVATCNALDLR